MGSKTRGKMMVQFSFDTYTINVLPTLIIFVLSFVVGWVVGYLNKSKRLYYRGDQTRNKSPYKIVNGDKICIKILDDLKKELCGVVDDENVKNYIENRIDGLILRIK